MVVGSPTILNLIPSGVMPVVYINQGDAGYDKEFLVYNDDSPYNVPSGVSATIRGKKADGYGVTEAATLTTGSNLVTVTITEQMVAAAGENLYELVFVDTDGLRIATINMVWAVKADALGDAVISNSDLNYVNEALDKIQNAEAMKNQLDTNTNRIAEEVAARTSADEAETAARIAADTTLQNNIAAEASARFAQDNVLQAEINQLVSPSGSAPSAAEVENARVGADGVTYSTLGDAIRSQDADLKTQILESDSNARAMAGYYSVLSFIWERGNLALSTGAAEVQKFAIRTGFVTFSVPTVVHILSNSTYRTTILKYDANGNYVTYFETSASSYNYTITGDDLNYQYRMRIMRRDLQQISQEDADGMITYYPQGFANIPTLAARMANLEGVVLDTLNIDSAFTTGFYRLRNATGTLPDGSNTATNKCLLVFSMDGWVTQYLYDIFEPETIYARMIRTSAPQYAWKAISHANDALTAGTNIDTVVKAGYYSVATPAGTLPPDWDATKSYALLVWGSGEQTTGQPRFIVQCLLQLFTTKIAVRQIDAYNNVVFDWAIVGNSGASALSMVGKKIVCFGDSITGNFKAPDDYPSMIAEYTGATVYNAGFGGCSMADNGQARRAYSMCRLADSIATGDWTLQENSGVTIDYAVVSQDGTRYVGSGTDYVASRLAMLEGIDWSDIDYITIAYGTNDWSSDYLLDNENNLYDTTTYLGALRYSIETILTAYPNIKIIPITPIWRWWDTGTGAGAYGDTDTVANRISGYKLSQFADGLITASATLYHIKAVDMYYGSGFNKYNRYQYFFTNDGTHPKPYGIEVMGVKIANALMCGIAR